MQKKIRQQILRGKVLTCMSTCKKRELALNNTTVVIMKLSSLLKPILYMKYVQLFCVFALLASAFVEISFKLKIYSHLKHPFPVTGLNTKI